MRFKIKDKFEDFKAWIILFLIKVLFSKEKREFVIRWTELKLNLIKKEHFDKWVTKQILED